MICLLVKIVERKRYLELCQQNAVKPHSVFVRFENANYYPIEYRLCFDGNGQVVNRVVLQDTKANSVVNCLLKEVEEYEN